MDVPTSWAHIVGWCREHAPATAAAIRPPASAALLARAEAATGGAWPEDLRVWYALADGTERTPAGYLLPFHCPLPLRSVMTHWRMWQEIWASLRRQETELEDVARLEAEPAGTVASMFLPSFVPIAEDQSGSDLFVDTRSGDLHGCVTEFVKGGADWDGPVWPSVAAMLADLATGLDAGRPVGGWRLPRVDRGCLDWEVAGA
jgi:cell wall assembly regulator SMI1